MGVVAITTLLAGCADASPTSGVDIGRVLRSQWQARYAGVDIGGLTAVVITPAGESFASTVPGTTLATHFRGALVPQERLPELLAHVTRHALKRQVLQRFRY